MARNRDCNRIRRASARHGTAGAGLANRLRHLTVRPRRAEGDRLQISPNAPLKCSRADVQRQRGIQLPPCHLRKQSRDPGLQSAIVGLADRKGKLALQAFDQLAIGRANWIAQTPRSVAAISMRPSGESARA